MTGTPSRTATASAARWGGKEAVGKAPARGTRTAYEASARWARGHNRLEARCHPDRRGVDAAGRWSEGHASYPGRSARVPCELDASKGADDARAEVSRGHSSRRARAAKGQTRGADPAQCVRCTTETQTRRLRCPTDPEGSGGTGERYGARASSEHGTRGVTPETRRRDAHGGGAAPREHAVAAYQRVVRNGGAPGVDGMTVEELMPVLSRALGANPRGTAQRHVSSRSRCGRWRYPNRTAGRADAGHSDGARSNDPTGPASSAAADLRPDVLGRRASAFVRDGARTKRSSVPASTSRRDIAGWWTWTSRSSSTASTTTC